MPLLDDDALGQVWLIECDDAVAGYIVVTWGWSLESGGREALIDEAYVRDPGRGVGGQALDAVLEECWRAGALSIYLETERVNEAARRFYGRHGFEEDDSIWMQRSL